MILQEKLVAKLDDLESALRTHVVKEEKQLPKVVTRPLSIYILYDMHNNNNNNNTHKEKNKSYNQVVHLAR